MRHPIDVLNDHVATLKDKLAAAERRIAELSTARPEAAKCECMPSSPAGHYYCRKVKGCRLDAAEALRRLSEDVLRCIDAGWKPGYARDYGNLGPILAEYIDDLRAARSPLGRPE